MTLNIFFIIMTIVILFIPIIIINKISYKLYFNDCFNKLKVYSSSYIKSIGSSQINHLLSISIVPFSLEDNIYLLYISLPLLLIIYIITKYYLPLNSITNKKLHITSIIHNKSGRFYQFTLVNDQLLTHKDVLRSIYNTLMSNETFINFGNNKVIIVSGISEDLDFNYHPNVLLTNNTPFTEYYNDVSNLITTQFNEGYQLDTVQYFKILVWNMDMLSNKNIKVNSRLIKDPKSGLFITKTQINIKSKI